MAVLLPALFVLLQLVLLVAAPVRTAQASAYVMMVLAPSCAALAALWRGRKESAPSSGGWYAVALALMLWAAGAFANLWNELILDHAGLMYRGAMLAFNLAAVPIAFLLASEWRPLGRRLVRWIDATLSLALGVVYFLLVWSMLTARGAPDEAGVIAMVWLMDGQNLYLALGALVRWRAADEHTERTLFGALASFALVNMLLVFVNNHYLAPNPQMGPEHSSIVTLGFALFTYLALRHPPYPANLGVHPALVRIVRSASPLLLVGALLMVSLVLIRSDYNSGTAGVLIAVIGFGLRSTVSQIRHITRGDILAHEHSRLKSIAWTDALTGIPNRRFLDQALENLGRLHRNNGSSVSVLMIDIDQFKQFNDRYGHPAGDACLRAVALVLQGALARHGDVLVRYGGEEFIALLHDADAAAARVVGERLRSAVQALGISHLDNPAGVVTVSLGLASAPRSGGPDVGTTFSAQSLVESADQALYQAKLAGRNRVAG